MKLYHCPQTRSSRVLWLVHELGLDVELVPVNVFAGEGRKPEHRAVHPHGFVPALEHDGEIMLESEAMLLWLADLHLDKGLAPALTSPLRARYCQWLVYPPATCDPALEKIMFHSRFLPENKRIPALVEQGKKTWAIAEKVIERGLGDGPFMLGDTFTAADVSVGSTVAWARFAGALSDSPVLAAYLERCTSRPAFARAYS